MNLLEYPALVFVASVVILWFAAWVGSQLGRSRRGSEKFAQQDFDVILGAALALLGLVIGFSFSMAISRYELRKTYEEGEANAIETAYLRAELLPEEDAGRIRELLRHYTDLRLRFYLTRDHAEQRAIRAETTQVQHQLWDAVLGPAKAQPTPVAALAVTAANQVQDAQGFSEEAWSDRIPDAAWGLMFGMALCCNVLVGYGTRRADWRLFFVLPLVVAVSLSFIADINSPHGGFVHIWPDNLMRLQQSLKLH